MMEDLVGSSAAGQMEEMNGASCPTFSLISRFLFMPCFFNHGGFLITEVYTDISSYRHERPVKVCASAD